VGKRLQIANAVARWPVPMLLRRTDRHSGHRAACLFGVRLTECPLQDGKRPRCCPYRGRQPWRFSSSARGANAGSKGSTGATKVGSKGKAPAVGHTKCYATGELPGSRRLARSEGEKMISWRLIVPAVLVAAAVAGCFTYFVTAPPPVEASPDIKGPDTRTSTFIDQRSRAEEEAKAVFERAAAAILRQAPELKASVGVNEPPTAEHIPLPKRRPLSRP
jgi:hypothetical protein